MSEVDWAAKDEEISLEIEKEEKMWERQGFHPGMIIIDPRLIQFKVNTIVAVLTEVLGVDSEQLQVMFKEKVLAQMKSDRMMLIEEKAKQSRPDLAIARKPGLLGPDGQPIRI